MNDKKSQMHSGKSSYLSFYLDKEEFAVNTNNVLNILQMVEITKLPNSPEYLKGVIDFRGSVLPVIDTRKKLGMTSTEISNNTCIVVMDLKLNESMTYLGFLVDQVDSVIKISESNIKNAPELSDSSSNEFLKGIAEVNDKFILILDMFRVFSGNELERLSQMEKDSLITN